MHLHTPLFALTALSLACMLPASAQTPGAAGNPATQTQSTADNAPSLPQAAADNAADGLDKTARILSTDTGSGVVTSQAVTVAGHDFCQYFIAAWREKEGSERYTLAIHERPSARRGSEVRIEFAQRRVFNMHLPAARAAIKSLSEDAAETTYQAVLQADAERRSINDADLAPDEF